LTGLKIYHLIYRNQCKVKYYAEKAESCGREKPHQIDPVFDVCKTDVVLPSGKPADLLAQYFSDFFVDKVKGIRNGIAETKSHQQTDNVVPEAPFNGDQFSNFSVVSDMEISKIIRNPPNKSCELDSIPTWLMKDCLNALLP
jgi:hypothetical protein